MSKFALSLLWGGNGRVCGFGLPSVSFWSGPARVARHAGRARGSVGMKAGVVLKTLGSLGSLGSLTTLKNMPKASPYGEMETHAQGRLGVIDC